MPIRLPVAPEPPVSISEMVQQHLREGILSGVLRAGQALKQDEIATRLGVSRAPVREALNQLERDGLAILRPRRGYIVASLETNEIADIFDPFAGAFAGGAVHGVALREAEAFDRDGFMGAVRIDAGVVEDYAAA